jgi:glycosyltransferase involved in cell wall biosynthesis
MVASIEARKRPLVSVLMPVFNGEHYLPSALNSVLGQTFSDFEFIVINDGSMDGTAHILENCRDARLKVFHLPHTGLIGALNEGIARCSCDTIARMDADDVSYPERLARQWQFLLSHPEVDVVTCRCDLLDEQGQVRGQTTGGVGEDMILELAAGNSIVHGSVMVRTTALPPSPVYARAPEDYRLWVTMARARRRFHGLAEVLYAFRTHGERYSLTHARSQSAGIVEVQWPLLEECAADRDVSQPQVRARLLRGWGNVAGAAYCAGDSQRGDAARRRFLELTDGMWDAELERAAEHGIEAMLWGGCPWQGAWSLRWLQWRHQPLSWIAYRNLLLTLPPVRKLRTVLRRKP